jgi:hypothetical protein
MKTKTHYENEDPSLSSYYENEDPKIFIYIVFAKISVKVSDKFPINCWKKLRNNNMLWYICQYDQGKYDSAIKIESLET